LGSTITEKILAHAAGVETVTPGEIITAKVDAVIGHDITTAAFRELEKMQVDKVFDRSKVYFTVDHFVPSPTLEAAAQLKDLGEYIKKYEIEHWFELRLANAHRPRLIR
jgi:3-isopropylmalate/(R)-2-methylmalate dehydratase large subunit